VLPHFMVVPPILAVTDLALVVPSRPAQRFAAQHGLQVVEPDLGLPPFPVKMHWHWRHTPDPGHRWLRERAVAMGEALRAPASHGKTRGARLAGQGIVAAAQRLREPRGLPK
jgi:hypothetical protein